MLIYLHATNQHPRLNHLGEMNQKPKKGISTLSHPCVAVIQVYESAHLSNKITKRIFKVKDAVVVTIKEEDAVLQKNLVMKEKETVMDLVMVVVMMVIMDVKEILYVEAIIARSLVHSTTAGTTVVRNQELQLSNKNL